METPLHKKEAIVTKATQTRDTTKASTPGALRRPAYPFAALVGQHEMQRGLLIATVDPLVGGVLILGDRGTGKSTAVRALADVLPHIDTVKGCPLPVRPRENCRAMRGLQPPAKARARCKLKVQARRRFEVQARCRFEACANSQARSLQRFGAGGGPSLGLFRRSSARCA